MNSRRPRAALIALLLVASVTAGVPASAEPSLTTTIALVNPGFEEQASDGSVPGWQTIPTTPAAGTSAQVTVVTAHGGAHSMLLDDQSTQYSLGLVSDRVAASAGDIYRATSQVFVEQTSLRGYVKFYGADGKELAPAATNVINTVGQWTELVVEGRAPEGTTHVQIWYYLGAAGTSRSYVDDVVLEQLQEEPQLPVSLGEREDLGVGVTLSMAASTAFGVGPDGENEQYLGLTGSPASFNVVNPQTGLRLFSAPMPGSDVVWAMATGSDGNIYFAGTTDGKLYRYLPVERRMEVVGVNPSDNFVWDLDASTDGKIYGATYPQAKVFEYDIASNSFRDLGSMMEGQQYARGVEVTDRYLYVGIGYTKSLVRYDRATGGRDVVPVPGGGESGIISEIQAIGDRLFVQSGTTLYVLNAVTHELLYTGQSDGRISPPSPGQNDVVYFKDANEMLHTYNLVTDVVIPVSGVPALSPASVRRFDWLELPGERAGRPILVGMSGFAETFFYDPTDGWHEVVSPDVPEQGTSLNVLSAAGGKVYAGGYQRGMSIFDEESGRAVHRDKRFHQPEGIGVLDGAVYFGTYGGARMYRLDPTRPLDYNETGPGNPGLVLDIEDEQDRPFAMHSADGMLFIGTIPEYGKLGGAVTVVQERRGADGTLRHLNSETFRDIVPDQGVTGLAYRDGLLFGSTTITGGLGVQPTAEDARIFVFDVKKKRKIAEFTPELPGVTVPLKMIGELTFGPDGLLWGAADGTIFALDPSTYQVVKSKVVYPTEFKSGLFRPIYLDWGPDGYLYTTLNRQLTVVDPETLRTRQLAQNVQVMTLGEDGSVYYGVGSRLYRLPRLP